MDATTATPIGEFYIGKQKEMDAKFGSVIIMVEIGKFYEVYTFEDGTGKAKEVSRVCNIVLTRKNKNLAPSMSNPYMCGFPSHSLSRYVRHLVSHGHTVAVYSQTPTMERELQGVYSPSVMVDDETLDDETDRCVLVLSMETTTMLCKKQDNTWVVAYVCINTTNGNVFCEEQIFYYQHDALMFVEKVFRVYNPQECILKGCQPPNKIVAHPFPHDGKYHDVGFQQIVLGKVYTMATMSVIESIDLERHPNIVAILTVAISFLGEHHPLAIYRLQKPMFLHHTDNVLYNTQSLTDLNLLDMDTNSNSLFSILDSTSTPAGKRLLRKMMLAPHHNINALNSSYDEISAVLPFLHNLQFKKFVSHHNTDAEHTFRRIQIGTANVPTLFRFLQLLFDVDDLVSRFPQHTTIVHEWKEQGPHTIKKYAEDIWDMTLMQSWRSWENDTIWKQTPPVLVGKQKELDMADMQFRKWCDQDIGKGMNQRIVFAEDEAYISITKKMYMELKTRSDLNFRVMSSSHRLYHPQITRHFHERKSILQFIVKTRRHIFQQQLKELVDVFGPSLSVLTQLTSRVDVLLSNANNAVRFRLQRPEPTTDVGVLSCQQLRHLVVETTNTNTDYIANNVVLSEQHGILLFGQNSAGKCFIHDTPIVLWDGTIKPIQKLTTDDVLVGDDGTPRHILTLTHGEGPLYDIVRCDTDQVLMTINAEHILCLTDGSHYWEETLKNVLRGHGHASMFQHTRRVAYHHTQSGNGVLVKRENGMDDNEWRSIYMTLLHSGRRIHYTNDCIYVEPVKNNMLSFWVRERTRHGQYFGFGLDGNQRFLMPDGNVCHNSTLMKSVGVSVMMAQCGMFVPCSSMKWSPITSIFTKIGSRDDIWRGKSTFITEMNELKHILDRADEKSLILCDELTSGTETFSATGIVAGTIEAFLEKQSKFIMTTHLHTLNQFQQLLAHPHLLVMHFSMEYDKQNKKLVFDRILREGSGKSIYGLEIAEYLNFPDTFLKRAFQYRSQLDPASTSIEPKRRSRYNQKKWVDVCEHCGCKTDLHTHHIRPQKDATDDGYIGLYHKNRLSNLKVLCRSCHEKEHHS